MYQTRLRLSNVLTWSAADALVTRTALLAYEYMLSYAIGAAFHGTFGYVISILYIAQGITNFGFDTNLAAYSEDIMSSRRNVYRFILGVWTTQIICIGAISCYLYTSNTLQAPILLGSLPSTLYLAWIIIFFIEAIRKTAKHLVRYTGRVQAAATIEVVGTLGYIGLAGIILFMMQPSVTVLLYVHALSASVQLCIFAGILLRHVKQLPAYSDTTFSIARFHMNRIFVGINEVAGTLYTGNFLIPFIVYSRGYEFASIFRLVWYTAQWFVLCIQQIFAATGSIMLAQYKKQPVQERINVFYTLTHYMHQIVYAGIFFVLINSRWLFVPQAPLSFSPMKALCIGFFLFALTVVDSFCAFYLRWYVVEEQAHSIALFNIFSIIGMDAIVRYQDFGDVPTIIAMFAIRTLAFVMISAWSLYKWNLRPSFRWSKESVIITVVISALWFVIHMW